MGVHLVAYRCIVVRKEVPSCVKAFFNHITLGVGGNESGGQGFVFLTLGEGAFTGVPVALTLAIEALVDD